MLAKKEHDSNIIKMLCMFITIAFLIASIVGAIYTKDNNTFSELKTILFSPSPLVTDYFELGSLSAAFFNAFLCSFAITLIYYMWQVNVTGMVLAGYFLVIAHTFYGLNFVNMWPTIIGCDIYFKVMGFKVRDNMDIVCFSTSFGPFFSELMFRYSLKTEFVFSKVSISIMGVILSVILAAVLVVVIPAMLPGAKRMHKGYNLYNGGLAFGLIGFLVYSFMYKTFGRVIPALQLPVNVTYETFNRSYDLFIILFYLVLFVCCGIAGYIVSREDKKWYRELVKETGHNCDFLTKYGAGCVLINLCCYGLLMLLYFCLVIYFTEGAGFTGPTTGIILAAMTFVAIGQHPLNVYPILLGYVALYVFVLIVSSVSGLNMNWTLSTQGYMNGVAFATGLCPISGVYGKKMGVAAGFISAVICTSTVAIHGGFVLYNGGFTAGITALILIPILEYYYKDAAENNAKGF